MSLLKKAIYNLSDPEYLKDQLSNSTFWDLEKNKIKLFLKRLRFKFGYGLSLIKNISDNSNQAQCLITILNQP
jgi:hypothetical protein